MKKRETIVLEVIYNLSYDPKTLKRVEIKEMISDLKEMVTAYSHGGVDFDLKPKKAKIKKIRKNRCGTAKKIK